jgi:hypothetical protein
MTKMGTPSQRLAKAIQARAPVSLAELGKKRPVLEPDLSAELAHASRLRHPLRQDDFDDNALHAMAAFQIDGAPKWLRAAFEAFGFDPNDPWRWRELLIILAYIHFGKRNAGRPRQYDDLQVLKDFATVKRRNPDKSNKGIFKDMVKAGACGGRYRSVGGIKKMLERMFKPPTEEAIARSLSRAQEEAQRAGKAWTRQAENDAKKRIRTAVINGTLKGIMRTEDRDRSRTNHTQR